MAGERCPTCRKPMLPKLPSEYTMAELEKYADLTASGKYHDVVACRGMDPAGVDRQGMEELLESVGANRERPTYVKLELRPDGLVMSYYGSTVPPHMIVGDNLRTHKGVGQAFPSEAEATKAFFGPDEKGAVPWTHKCDNVRELEAIMNFTRTSYALQIGASLRTLIRRFRWRFGIAGKGQRIWMTTWEQLGGRLR